ncbi:hypothetical protein [Actinomadura craniellae]|uniref:hypothetical protein n=1 Tax=Actinomadura craniellae TaxID=2231787 RepID=UPI0013144CE1|nr:hypothetical protein [Actinomadura craniellae]
MNEKDQFLWRLKAAIETDTRCFATVFHDPQGSGLRVGGTGKRVVVRCGEGPAAGGGGLWYLWADGNPIGPTGSPESVAPAVIAEVHKKTAEAGP